MAKGEIICCDCGQYESECKCSGEDKVMPEDKEGLLLTEEEMKVGDKVQLNRTYINQQSYPYSELAKLRYFTILELPDEYGVVKLRREDLASHKIESYNETFLEPVI